MCTALLFNGSRTIVGWNLDIKDMEARVVPSAQRVAIEVLDKTEGWMPIFGANSRGDFVAMPTCWPHDPRSNPTAVQTENIIRVDWALLFGKMTLADVRELAQAGRLCSVPGLTFQAQLSDRSGNVLQIVPGQGYRYLEHPRYAVMTNFSPFKMDSETHPWMGWDRYGTATRRLAAAPDNFAVDDCLQLLQDVAQTVCPTVISMVFDVSANRVVWTYPQQPASELFQQQLS